MPLFDGYGVLVGRLTRYSCDKRQDEMHYYHCTLMVKAAGELFRCAVDLDSKQRKDGIQWRVVELSLETAGVLTDKSDGWHDLASDAYSGALDYYRSPALASSAECIHADRRPEGVADGVRNVHWSYGTGAHAFRDLESLLRQQKRIFIFGEPFRNGRGVHNIHQNQGDPPGSRWVPENGIWQDGAVIVERFNRSVAAFLCKFSTQRFCIDDRVEETDGAERGG